MISVNSELFTLKNISQCFYRPNNGQTLLFYHCIVAFSSGQLLTDKQNRMSPIVELLFKHSSHTLPDASVCKINLLEKSGLRKTGSLQIQSFNLSNAFCVVSDHLTLFGTFFFVRSVKGTDMSENCGMNFLLKPIRPKNDRICFFVTGTGNCRMAETLS